MKSKAIIIIPARYGSTRFEGKPLKAILGKTMLERVWNIAQSCKHKDAVFIATDDDRIQAHAQSFNAKVIMTSHDCLTGTDRVAQAAEGFAQDEDIVISLQGDALLTPPWVIDAIIDCLKNNPDVPLATPAVKLMGQQLHDFLDHKKISPSSGTTVVMNPDGLALYFSKTPIPYHSNFSDPNASLYRHIGLYGYRFKTLKRLQSLAQTPLERCEKLEQLRALENDIAIKVVQVDYQGRSHGSIDTPKDVAFVEKIIQQEGELVS